MQTPHKTNKTTKKSVKNSSKSKYSSRNLFLEKAVSENETSFTIHSPDNNEITITNSISSNNDYCCFIYSLLKIGGGFLQYVYKTATSYHMDCVENGITPIRHLSLYYFCIFPE